MTPTPARPRRDASADSSLSRYSPGPCRCAKPVVVRVEEAVLIEDAWHPLEGFRYCNGCGGDL